MQALIRVPKAAAGRFLMQYEKTGLK